MKIISKHKDYYDYLQGIYGIDEMMVYDRRTDNLVRHQDIIISDSPINGPSLNEVVFAICNKTWTLYEYKGVVYHTPEELVKLHKLLIKDGKDRSTFLTYGRWSGWAKSLEDSAKRHYKENNTDTDINRAVRQPILIKVRDGEFTHTKPYTKYSRYRSTFMDTDRKISSSWSIPILSEFGLPKYYPADALYQDVSAFIAWMKDHPEIPNKQTDKEKLKSHGFDDKISFRHRKK